MIKNNLSYDILKWLISKVLGQKLLHLFQSNKAFKLNRLLGRKIFLPFCFLSPRPVDPVAGPSFNFCGKTRKRPRKDFLEHFLSCRSNWKKPEKLSPSFSFSPGYETAAKDLGRAAEGGHNVERRRGRDSRGRRPRCRRTTTTTTMTTTTSTTTTTTTYLKRQNLFMPHSRSGAKAKATTWWFVGSPPLGLESNKLSFEARNMVPQRKLK